MHDELITRADALEAEDRRLGRPALTRIRIGIYVYDETLGEFAEAQPRKESDEN